ncbi:hypothetical protein Ddc_18558 [Ditylenchus destructor]|nr:hypothetical protein Ddc_18558 [Ditylenchus destructor]
MARGRRRWDAVFTFPSYGVAQPGASVGCPHIGGPHAPRRTWLGRHGGADGNPDPADGEAVAVVPPGSRIQMAVRGPDDRVCAVYCLQRDAGQHGLRGDQCDAAVDGGGRPGDGLAPPWPTPGSPTLLIVNARCLKD